MKKLLLVLLVGALCLVGLYLHRREAQRWLFQKALSAGGSEFFDGPIRLKDATLDRGFKMHLHEIRASLKSDSGPAPIQITRVQSGMSLLDYFSPQGTSFEFDGLKPAGSASPGISGRAELKSEGGGHFHLNAKIEGLDLSEIQWLNPDNLRGSKGAFTGSFTADGKYTESPNFQAVITSKDGLVQAKFFSVLLPYLPALPTKSKMAKLSAQGEVVSFKDAAIRAEMAGPQTLKIFLHILIPDYNVILNINFEIRLEETVSFTQLAQTLGLLKVTA